MAGFPKNSDSVCTFISFDHYCGLPLSTTKGDFKKPAALLFFTKHTENYKGEPVAGTTPFEMTGDYATAFLRVMPHSSEPKRMAFNMKMMNEEVSSDTNLESNAG